MKEIILSDGQKAIVDDSNYNRLSKFKWQSVTNDKCVYARRSVNDHGTTKSFLMHHEILGKKKLDHIDGNGLNNRLENLRECTATQNMQNRRKHICKTSEFKGVSFKSGKHQKFESMITVNGTKIPLGYFSCEIEAAKEYNLAAALFFGEFANLNPV